MTSRKLPFKDDDETPNKRQRILDSTTDNVQASFDALNNDCVLYIASFLPIDDVNTFGTINRRCRVLRRHESLDQTRIATIICSQRSTLRSFGEALNAARGSLGANYTHLNIVGLEVVESDRPERDRIPVSPLPNVTKLELISPNLNEQSNNSHIAPTTLNILHHCLPNISVLILNCVKMSSDISPRTFGRLTHLERVHHVGDGVGIDLTGFEYMDARTLTCLIIDGCSLYKYAVDPRSIGEKKYALHRFSDDEHGHGFNFFVLRYCRQLQRLSIKGATWRLQNVIKTVRSDAEPIPQEMLIKMVRHHPALRWLRNDLSEENVAMLQRERPEITFVSD